MKKIKAIILAIILFIISLVVIIINGNNYVINVNMNGYTGNEEGLNVIIEDESIVKCTEKNLYNNILTIKLESVSKGKTYISVKNDEDTTYYFNPIFVHNFNIITINEYMGDSNSSIIIPISITTWLIYLLYLLIISYKKNLNENIYQYKNIAYLGVIIFTLFSVIRQLLSIFNYMGIIETINGILNMFTFLTILFPLTFVVSILVMISNFILIKKEGFNLKNLLGVFLGITLCIFTMAPDFMYNMLYTSTFIDIHNQNSIGLYIYNLVEEIIVITVTYVECILIGTIIIGFKSAKYKPNYDKDYIVILGCQIRKDGSLTPLLKGRVDKAIEFGNIQKEKTNKEIIFVPSGGKGSDEIISEAQAMKNYLLSQGIKEENILMEDKSKNTYENIEFSNKLIKEKMKNAKVAFCTTNYHVFRAGNIASQQNLNIEGIGSKTKSYFWINAFIREFIATIFAEKKKHLIVICIIIFIAIFMIAMTYFNNNL